MNVEEFWALVDQRDPKGCWPNPICANKRQAKRAKPKQVAA